MTTPVTVSNFNATFVEQLNANFASIDNAIDAIDGYSIGVASLADLKALPVGAQTGVINSQYRSTAGDGGGGTWVWRSGDQSANVSADTQSGIWAAPATAPTGASGAWQRQCDSTYHAAWFGAFPDGSDATAALTAAINALPSDGGTVMLDGYSYTIASAITLTRGAFKLVGRVGTALNSTSTTANHITVGTVGGTYLYNVHIEQITFTRSSVCSAGYAIDLANVGYCLFRNLRIFGASKQYQGVRLRSCNTITFENIRSENILKEHLYMLGLSSTPAGVDGNVINITLNDWYVAGAHASSTSLATQGAIVLDDFCGGVWLNKVTCDAHKGYAVYLKGTLANIAGNTLIYINGLNVESSLVSSGAVRVDYYRGVYLNTEWISGLDLDAVYIGTNASSVYLRSNTVAIAYSATEKAAVYCNGSYVDIEATELVGYSTNAHNTGLSLGTNADKVNMVGGSFYQLNKAIDAVTYTGGKVFNITGARFSGNSANAGFNLSAAHDFQIIGCNGVSNYIRGTTYIAGSAVTAPLQVVAGASNVNYLAVYGGASGGSPEIDAAGSDTNITIKVKSKGTGNVALASPTRDLLTMLGADPSSGTTSMYLTYHNGASITHQNVTVGAADSGGAGYKLLRVPN